MMKIVLLVLFLAFVLYADADCRIRVGLSKEVSPLFVKNFGSKQIIFKSTEEYLDLNNGEELRVYCMKGFELVRKHDENYGRRYRNYDEPPNEYFDVQNVELQCSNKKVTLRYPGKEFDLNTDYQLRCLSNENLQLFESTLTLPGCNDHSTFALGSYAAKFGICYDFNRMSILSVNYFQDTINSLELLNSTGITTVNLAKKINNFGNFFKSLSPSYIESYDFEKFSPLLVKSEFEYASLVENRNGELGQYEKIFKVLWWRNLHEQNWKLFENAVKDHAKAKIIKYNAYTGISGVLEIPDKGCNETKVVSVTENEVNVFAPKYIWSFYKFNGGNDDEDFVVIGYNSPLSKLNDPVVFCEDICNEISWLKNFVIGKTRMMPAKGIVFCCRPDEVANKLDNFPLEPNAEEERIEMATVKVFDETTPSDELLNLI